MSVSQSHRQLYELLPAVHQIRDHRHGEPLKALLEVIGEQVGLVHDDVDKLYENWFIETCDDWVVPYIADLIGFRKVYNPGEPPDALASGNTALNSFLFPRREVANTVGLRRRKGTLAVLEELADQVAGWRGRAVQFDGQVFTTPNLNYLHCGYGRTLDLRDDPATLTKRGPPTVPEQHCRGSAQIADHNTPFNTIHHTVDLRSPQTRPGVGWYHPFNVGLFVWRRNSYPMTRSQPQCIEGQHGDRTGRYFAFNPLGMDVPLQVKPEHEVDPCQIAQPINLPIRLTRALLNDNGRASTDFYGLGKSVVILDDGVPVPAENVVPADLSDIDKCIRCADSCTGEQVWLDPESGRFLFAKNRHPCDIRASWHYGFAADLGGGEYDRNVPFRSDYDVKRIAPNTADCSPFDLTAQLKKNLSDDCRTCPPADPTTTQLAVSDDIGFELTGSDTWRLDNLDELRICAGKTLELRAANRTRPVVEVDGTTHDCEPALKIVMEVGSRLILDGLLLFGGAVDIVYSESDAGSGDPCPPPPPASGECPAPCDCNDRATLQREPPRIDIRHCTLFPGGRPSDACGQCANSTTSLRLRMDAGRVTIGQSIVGSVDVPRSDCDSCLPAHGQQQETNCPVRQVELCIHDSIVDGCRRPPTIGAGCCGTAHANLVVRRTTIFGSVRAERIREAVDSIFYGLVQVPRIQEGYMRFCWVARSELDLKFARGCSPEVFQSRTPRRFKCQPDSAGTTSTKSCGGTTHDNAGSSICPKFISTEYGYPGYGQLSLDCPTEVSGGAESESEMGAFHDLFVPQRHARLRQQLADFTPANMRSAIIVADDLERNRDTN